METQIISQKEYQERNLEREIDGAVVYDGDGDGASAVAIWLMQNPGKYVTFTNQQKGERELVKGVFKTIPAEYLERKKCGVFDISAEQNLKGLENLAQTASEVDFIFPFNSKAFNGLKNPPVSSNASPYLKIFITTGSPCIKSSHQVTNLTVLMCNSLP